MKTKNFKLSVEKDDGKYFECGLMNLEDYAKFSDSLNIENGQVKNFNLVCFRLGRDKIQKIVGYGENKIDFSEEKMIELFGMKNASAYITEIGMQILNESKVSDDERKN